VQGDVDNVAPFIFVNEQSESNPDCNFHSSIATFHQNVSTFKTNSVNKAKLLHIITTLK